MQTTRPMRNMKVVSKGNHQGKAEKSATSCHLLINTFYFGNKAKHVSVLVSVSLNMGENRGCFFSISSVIFQLQLTILKLTF